MAESFTKPRSRDRISKAYWELGMALRRFVVANAAIDLDTESIFPTFQVGNKALEWLITVIQMVRQAVQAQHKIDNTVEAPDVNDSTWLG